MIDRFPLAASVFASMIAVFLLAGCARAVDSSEPAAGEKAAAKKEEPRFTHVVARPAPYYRSGPQQGRAPDGRFQPGTKVRIVERGGAYAVVETAEGLRVHVAAGSLQRFQPEVPAEVKTLVEGHNRFAFDLYGQLKDQPDNLFYSPYSISTALAMTYAGARGETASQIARTLHFDLPADKLHPASRLLAERIQPESPAEADYALKIANRLWGQQGYDFLPAYLELTRTHYDAELAELDFVRQAEAARQVINDWIEQQTERKIRDLIPPGVLDDMTRLVLTNAIYFKGDWAEPFDKNETQQAPFHVTSDKTTEVPLMFRKGDYRYADLGDAQLLELPYTDEALSMLVLLPKQIDGLPALEEKLTAEALAEWTGQLRKREVRVYFPRFKTTAQFQLKGALQALGMEDAFVPDRADFSGMNGRRDLYVSAVVHKGFVEVNEEGTEAAAATGVVVGITAAPAESPTFRADRPFVFLIRDNGTGSILFVGRMRNPNAEG